MLTWQNGILNRAGEAKEKTDIAQIDEIVKLAIAEAITEGTGTIDKEKIENSLNKYFQEGDYNLVDDSNGWIITVAGKKYHVTSNGGLSSSDKADDNKEDNSKDDDKDENESWEKLTATDKVERLKNMSAGLAVFDKSVSGTESDYNAKIIDDDYNTIEKSATMDKAECQCGKVREIFNKAVEMNLVKDYTDLEIRTITSDDGTERNIETIFAPIEEESIVLFVFYTYNFEQKPGGIIPMALTSNYSICPNGKEWLDGRKPDFSTGSITNSESDGGDRESILAWINEEYAKNGFVGMQARLSGEGYKDMTITKAGQVVHRKISVLTKTDFVKAMKELNLDLSEYEGKCVHPVK